MEPDDLGNGMDYLVGKTKGAQALFRHLGPYHLVMMERDPVFVYAARLWFSDVVQQSGEAKNEIVPIAPLNDCQRVFEHVLVVMDWVLLELESTKLRQIEIGEPGRIGKPEGAGGGHALDQLHELVADPFG
jgi:hypothetical protein